MVDVSNGFSLLAEFAACNHDLSEAQDFINSFNEGKGFYSGIDVDNGILFYEHDTAGVLIVPLDDVASLYEQNPEIFERLLEEQPGVKEKLDQAVKELPYCGPDLLGQAAKPLEPFA